MGCQTEQLDLLRDALEGGNRDVDVSHTCLHKGLGLLRVLALAEGMAAVRQANNLEDEALRDPVKVDEEASGVSIDVQCLVEVLSVVNFLDKLHYDVGNPIYLALLAHEVNLVVQSLCNLEDRVNEEAIA